MLTKKMTDSLNDQLNKEMYSAYLYLSMSAHAQSIGMAGAANWFYVQVKEEMIHSERFFNYINQQGGKVELKAIGEPEKSFKSPSDMFQKTLEHERLVTKSIHNLVDIARKESDHATDAFLQWFVTEQVEEEANATEILQKFKLIGNDGNGLLTIDSQLATRVFVPPVPAGNAAN